MRFDGSVAADEDQCSAAPMWPLVQDKVRGSRHCQCLQGCPVQFKGAVETRPSTRNVRRQEAQASCLFGYPRLVPEFRMRPSYAAR